MQHRMRIRDTDQLRVEIEIIIQAAISFRLVNRASHEQVSRVMIAFGLYQAGIKSSQFHIDGWQFASEHLKFFAASAFDQRAANQVVDDLRALAIPNRAHQTTDPRAGIGLAEGDAAALQQIEHELEMLEFFDGDGVEFLHASVEIAIFLEV